MRLSSINQLKARFAAEVQQLQSSDISDVVPDRFALQREPLKRRIARFAGPLVVRLGRRSVRRTVEFQPSFNYDEMIIGERFGNDVSLKTLLRLIRNERIDRVLVGGCYQGGQDVQFWLRRGVRHLVGIDVYSLGRKWQQIVPALRWCFDADVEFLQASLENIPLPHNSFDLVVTEAALEHVRNLHAMAKETSRILRPGGFAWHGFGPLYFTYGGDHCISAFGEDAGFDHILLSDAEYTAKISNRDLFKDQLDPNLPFWAANNQFSFAYAREYLDCFKQYFEIKHVLVKISEDALQFRRRYPQKWNRLLQLGISAENLLIKSLGVVLRKPMIA